MIIKSHTDSDSFIKYTQTSTYIAAGQNSISTDKEAGNFINGPLAITTSFTNIRWSGMFKFNNLLALGIPSTLITPVSVFDIELPMKELAGYISLTSVIMSAAMG